MANTHASRAATTSGPVTVRINRRVKAGCESAYIAQLELMMEHTRHLPGYLGGTTQRARGTMAEYCSVLRFDAIEHLEAFEQSPQRRQFAQDVADLVEADAIVQRETGLEFWFVPPAGTAVAQPSRWRMSVLLVAIVYSLITTISALVGPYLGGLPPSLRMLVVVALQVILMTYVVMPRVTRWLVRWLYPAAT